MTIHHLPAFLFSFLISHTFFGQDLLPESIPVKAVKKDILFMAEHEVSNREYRDFLNSFESDSYDYLKYLPDSNLWNQGEFLYLTASYRTFYFRDPAYSNDPVVNVSKQQAEAYCHWLSVEINRQLTQQSSQIKKIEVRLPTEKEWEYAARGGLDTTAIFPWEGTLMINSDKRYKGMLMANFRRSPIKFTLHGSFNNSYLTRPVISYWPNGYGLYNMAGNVAEIVSDAPITKGGSWWSTGYYLQIPTSQPFESPGPNIGFRYAVEILEFHENPPIGSLKAKEIERSLATFSDQLMVGKYEVTNTLFNFFLTNSGLADSTLKYQADLWKSHVDYQVLTTYGNHPDYQDYPVVNITHEAALAFCEWLTSYYNSLPKKRFKSLRFRLPTEAEWMAAAGAGTNMHSYPWIGSNCMNRQGDFRCNYNPREFRFIKVDSVGSFYYDYPNGDISVSRAIDGGDRTLPVHRYEPNAIGLYQTAGNAAEMINIKGISKGGSWLSIPDMLLIQSKGEYDSPGPDLGFRVVADITEE